jgi:VCBS repeat-containing protein
LSGGSGSCELTLNIVGDRTLTATYSGGSGFSPSSGTAPHTVIPPTPSNEPPDADYNWHCEGLTCRFTDASEDDDGDVVSWNWNFGGTGTSAQQNPSHTFPGPGEYEVTLTVRDDRGASDASTAEVDVEAPPPPNQPPTAEFTWRCDELDCEFESESRDADGRIEDYDWTFGDGESSDDDDPDHEYPRSGTYEVRLSVTDDDGAESSVTHSVTVAEAPPPNAPPTAAFTAPSCTVGEPCEFVGESSDSDGIIASRVWTFQDATPSSSTDPRPSVIFTSGGSKTVTLTVTDDDGATDTETKQVTVTAAEPENQAPVAQPDAYATPGAGQPLTVDAPGVLANDSDPDVGDNISAQNASDPAQGSVSLNSDGAFTYTPDVGATGSDSFTYEASDGSETTQATVTITINP